VKSGLSFFCRFCDNEKMVNRSRGRSCFICLVGVVLFTEASIGGARLVSRAVGQVGSQVVTSREVQISYAIDQAVLTSVSGPLSSGKAPISMIDRKTWIIEVDDDNFRPHLSQIMTELLVRSEAESFSVAQITADEVRETAGAAKARLQDLSEWRRWEVEDSEIEEILRRRKATKQFLKFKTESSGVVIGDEEAKIYFEKNKVKFGSASFVQFKGAIKEVLAERQLEEKLKDWFEVLKRKYRVRFLNAEGVKKS
jgi:hypothetical protein